MTNTLTFSLAPGEVVPVGTTIELTSDTPIDAASAQGAVRLVDDRGEPIRVLAIPGDDGLVVRVPLGKQDAGRYTLVVGELLSAEGERLVERAELPFTVNAFAGDVSRDLRVEHVVRLAVRDLDVVRLGIRDQVPDGELLELVKAVHRETGEPVSLAFDARGVDVDGEAMLRGVDERRAQRFGLLHETLATRLDGLEDDAEVEVLAWPRWDVDPAGYDKPADRPLEEPHEYERRVDEEIGRALEQSTRFLEEVGATVREKGDPTAPVVAATLPVGILRRLSDSPDAAQWIGGLFLDDRSAVLDLGTSIVVARSDAAHTLGFDGSDVRVAVFENGPKTTTNLALAGRFTTSPSSSTAEDEHARLTHAIVRNTETGLPHGHAPAARLFSADSSDNAALRWAIDQRCTVISQSFHRGSEPGGAGLQADDLLKDWMALRFPYPTIVQAAGNFWSTDPDDIDPPESEYVNHKGYNTLSVGNHDDTAATMSGSSVFRNPSSAHGDRELPEIAANGTAVSANGQSKSGTSFSAPAVAGVAALLQDVDPVLRSWPEGCRAILLATADRNVSGSTWWADVAAGTDASDGAGAVNAEIGVRVAGRRRHRDAAATAQGWDVGTLRSSDFGRGGEAVFRYRVQVPRVAFAPRVKVALAWDSQITSIFGIPLASTLTNDFDLIVRDSSGATVAVAASYDNSYEIAEFAARRGAQYEIVIRRWSGSADVWFGVAWTVRNPLLRPFPVISGIAERLGGH